jgi:hypothetical protein
MLKVFPRTALISAFALAAIAGSAVGTGVGLVATITVPGNKLDNFDIGYVDSNAGRYYVADRSNSAIDIIDTGVGIPPEKVSTTGIPGSLPLVEDDERSWDARRALYLAACATGSGPAARLRAHIRAHHRPPVQGLRANPRPA